MEQKTKLMAFGALATAAFATVMLAGPPAPPQVSVDEVNPGTSVERDLCLSVSLAPGAASECGDLRLAHALPAVRTLNQARAPVLIYNSQHASPKPIVAAHVTLPDGSSGLSRVVATLKVNGTPRGQGVWKGSAWPGSGPVRIAVAYDAASDPTGPYRYTLEVRAHYGADTVSATARGQLVVVNRRDSPFGAGWWLAGLERLVLDPFGKPLLWVGGDGSTRRYTFRGDSMWGAPSLDRPDSIVQTATGWARLLPGRVRVEFDTAGRHVATVNRLKRRTEFLYDAAGRLDTVTVPLGARGFAFVYGADGRLERAESPGLGTAPRVTKIHQTGLRVDSITDPDTTRIRFAYANAGALVPIARRNRMGVPTHFRFDGAGRIAGTRIDPNDQDSIVTRLRAVESLGLAIDGVGALDTARAYALMDGPRKDVGDSTRLWLDRWGAPRRIVDAAERQTVLERDARFPALVAKTTAPNGLVTRTWYGVRGTVDSTTTFNPYGDGRNATARFEYTDVSWPELPTLATQPEGETSRAGYDPETGDVVWRQVGADTTRRVTFQYYRDPSEPGYAPGLLKSVTLAPLPEVVPGSEPCEGEVYNCPPPVPDTVYTSPPPERIAYDTLGNVHTVTDPLGAVVSTTERDDLGRPWRVSTPTQSGKPPMVTTTTYKANTDLVETSQTVGPDINNAPRQTLHVRNEYEGGGLLRSVTRWSDPDTAQIGRIINEFRYDAAGRRVAEVAPHPPGTPELKDSTVYDPAGNVRETVNRNGHSTTYVYDELNRLRSRRTDLVHFEPESIGMARSANMQENKVEMSAPGAGLTELYPHGRPTGYGIAAGVDTFAYHPTDGTLTDADNASASVHFEYYANGQPRAARTTIYPWVAGEGSPHTYETEIGYDLNGRRTSIGYPDAISPSTDATVRYGYSTDGEVDRVQDLSGSALSTRYRYTRHGQLETRELTDGSTARFSQTLGYYDDGNLRSDVVRIATTTVRSQNFTYDQRGKRTGMVDNAEARPGSDINVYDGLGHLRQSTNSLTSAYSQTSTYQLDALANIVQRSGAGASIEFINRSPSSTTSSNNGEEWNYYQHGTGRLLYSKSVPARSAMDTLGTGLGGGGPSAVVHWYDYAGNAVWKGRAALHLNPGGWPYSQGERRMYYGADGKLYAVDARALYRHPGAPPESNAYGFSRSFEEYRYDALGRRVVTKFDQECDRIVEFNLYNAPCQISGIRRTLWDGSQEIGEIQVPNAALENDSHVGQGDFSSGRNLSPFYGAVAYVYDGRVDQPVAVTRLRYSNYTQFDLILRVPTFTYYPIWNVRGESEFGYTTTTVPECSSTMAGGDRATCITFVKKERWLPYRQVTDWQRSWQGSLVEDKVGTSGLMYRRNRYYDPATGRFTQEDPIGVAGGLNLYGFANGDPVSYDDPYGLKADSIKVIDHKGSNRDEQVIAGFESLANAFPWFRTAYNAIANSSEYHIYVHLNAACPGGGSSCQGTRAGGRTADVWVDVNQSVPGMQASAGHEMMHAFGDLAIGTTGLFGWGGRAGASTGINTECGRPDGSANGCIAYYGGWIRTHFGFPKSYDEDADRFAQQHNLSMYPVR